MNETQTPPVIPPESAHPSMGLSSAAAQQRLACGLGNTVTSQAGRTELQIIAQNSLTFFNFVFLALALVLVLCGSSPKNMTFLIIVFVNTIIGCFQEIRAKRAVDKLTLIAARNVRTIRDGKVMEVRSDLLVRDDIVEFASGDQVCADGILRTGSLQVNESLITGEADAIMKKPGDSLKSGSFIVAGRGRVQLTKVGDASFAARLAAEAKADPKATKSEMMSALDKLIRFVGFALIPVGCLLFYQEFKILSMSARASAESTVAALVGMIPEGLYLLTSVALAVSSLKLTRQRVLVQDMNCIETLARVDVLCVDKTGTITEPVMEVENVIPLSADSHEYLEEVMNALYGTREPDNDTARAISDLFGAPSSWNCTRYIPFTSQAKWSGGVFENEGAFLVGAPEFIMGSSYASIEKKVTPWSSTGYRVLLVARYHGDPQPGALDGKLVEPMALLLLTSRIREQAPATFAYFAQQGVTVKVISGDNPATVADVAARAGIKNADKYIDAAELKEDKDFLHAVETYTVFGRVTPDKKKKLIQALKKQGHTVAMTGDGVNDVLAMKEAHCGIAMASGSQAASQVAKMVLLDSDFAAMPSIVAEGRRVINNIQRAATLFLVKNIFSLGLSLISLFTQQPYPLAPLHMSVISAITIGIPSFFLAMEPNYERVSGRFMTSVLRKAFPGGLTNIGVVLMAQALMVTFHVPLSDIRAICTAVLAGVGLMVLYQVGSPLNVFRKIVWWSMAVLLVGCFTLMRFFLELNLVVHSSALVMVVLLVTVPTVYRCMQSIFAYGDRAWKWLQDRVKKP